MTVKLTTLGEVLAAPDSFSPALRLYMSFAAPWTLTSECVLSDEGDAEPPPSLAAERGMEYVIGLDAVQDAVVNATTQKPELTDSERFEAFAHYYDNDAFMVFADQKDHD